MKRFRRIGLIALASGVLAFLVVPYLIPFESSGTLTAAEAAGPEAEFVTLAGLEVHIKTAEYSGESADEPPLIVLLHGFGASTFSWRDVLESLARSGDVIAYDRPGFGFTVRPTSWEGANPYGTPGNLVLLDELLTAYAPGDREVILVGHSAGGAIAAEFARTNPDAVDLLVLVSPAVYSTGGVPGWLAPALSFGPIDRLGPILVGGIASSGEELLRQSFVDQSLLTPAVYAGYRRPLSVAGWEEALWRFVTAPRDNELAANVGGVDQPVLLVTGSGDTVVPTSDTERLAGALPDAELIVIPRSGHLPHEEMPAAFIDAVVDWIDGAAAP